MDRIFRNKPLSQFVTGVRTNYNVKPDPGDDCAGTPRTAPNAPALTVRSAAMPGYSPVGTCAMCPVGGRTAVVDSETLAVEGVQGLRVADCSVAPTLVSGGGYALAVMIGERAAEFVLRASKA